jgi:hypothetical protein
MDSSAKSVSGALAGNQQTTDTTVVAAGVIGMVDALRKFDATGNVSTNLLKPNDVLHVEVKDQAMLIAPQDASKDGFLAS